MASNAVLVLLLVGVGTAASPRRDKRKDLFPSDCGRRPFFDDAKRAAELDGGNRMARIINGNDAPFGKYPWLVALLKDLQFLCGGALINSRWVMTAAHCVDQEDEETVTVLLGKLDILRKNETLDSITRNAFFFVHPKYITGAEIHEGYDLALLKLSDPITFRPHIQPICLPTLRDMKKIVGRMGQTAGWGDIYLFQNTSLLQEVSLPIIGLENCKEIIVKNILFGKVDESHICAGYQHGKFSSCFGDSGSPLQLRRKDGRWFTVGLTSWGDQICGRDNAIVIFTSVSYHLPWIRRTMIYHYSRD